MIRNGGLLILVAAYGLAGCSAFRSPAATTLTDVQNHLREDFKNGRECSISDLIAGNAADQSRAEAFVREQQCFFESSNPMLIFTDKMTLELRGLVTARGELKIPATGGTASVSAEDEQKIIWPITIRSLGAMPDLYLELKLARLQALKDVLVDPERGTLVKEALADYRALKGKVEALQKQFDVSKCPRGGRDSNLASAR